MAELTDEGEAAVTTTFVFGATYCVTVNDPFTYEVGLYEVDVPPEQWVTYVPAAWVPVNAVAKPVSDDAYTAQVGSTDQFEDVVDGEVVYEIEGIAVAEFTDDGEAAVTATDALLIVSEPSTYELG